MTQRDLAKIAQRLLRSGRMPSVAAVGRGLKQAAGNDYGAPFTAVSSSTREGSTYDHALADAGSPTHRDLEHDTPGGTSGIGFWADGAEPSRIVPETSPKDAARLGLKYKQKAVLHFDPRPDGPHQYYRLDTGHLGLTPKQVAETLQRHGVEYSTVTPTAAHVVDLERVLAPNVAAAAKALGAPLHLLRGHGQIIGSYDSREEGAKAFQKLLQGDD